MHFNPHKYVFADGAFKYGKYHKSSLWQSSYFWENFSLLTHFPQLSYPGFLPSQPLFLLCIVNIKTKQNKNNTQTWKNFVSLSQADNCQEEKSQLIEKCSRKWQFCTLFYALQSKEKA